MSLDAKGAAALALHRFGLGPRAGSIAAIASDPRGALLAELEKPGIGQIADKDMLTAPQAARLAFHYNQEQQAKRISARISEEQRKTTMAVMTPMEEPKPEDAATMAVPEPAVPAQPTPPQQNVNREVEARIAAAVNAEIGFVERLVWFWSNHLCVSADKGGVRPICGAYEREAIRAHVLGRFRDMLLAVESHPAMLLYLDNARSIGPDSVAGLQQGRAVLANLSRHSATAHHIADKLVRHFVADDPPPVLIERLSRRFLDTDGNLKELAVALVTAPEAWNPVRSKLKRPGEWIAA